MVSHNGGHRPILPFFSKPPPSKPMSPMGRLPHLKMKPPPI